MKYLISVFITCFFSAYLPVSAFSSEIRVAIAANMTNPSVKIKERFEKLHPGTTVTYIIGSSGKLTSQIINGAPYDLFLSADTQYPLKVKNSGIALGDPAVYAKGKIVLFSISGFKPGSGISCIAESKFKKIAVANPELAPYGKASIQVLNAEKLYPQIKNKLIYAESISGTLQLAVTAADAAFIAMSSLHNKDISKYNVKGLYWLPVDSRKYQPLKQSMILLKRSSSNSAAADFFRFMQSAEVKSIMRGYGYD